MNVTRSKKFNNVYSAVLQNCSKTFRSHLLWRLTFTKHSGRYVLVHAFVSFPRFTLCIEQFAEESASCLIYARPLLEYVIFILWLRSVSKMLPSVKFAEDKVLTFLILREKC